MADRAGITADICYCADLFLFIGKNNPAFFMEDTDTINIFLPGDIIDDLGDVLPNIIHHAVARAEFNGITETVSLNDNVVQDTFFDVIDTEQGKKSHADKKDCPNSQYKFQEKTFTFGNKVLHPPSPWQIFMTAA